MDLHPTPFPVKPRILKPRTTRKISEPPKINPKVGSFLQREKRIFGTVRNPNIPAKKTATEKPAVAKPKPKPSSALLKKAPKPSRVLRPPQMEAKKSSLKTPATLKNKSVCFEDCKIERNGKKSLDDGIASEPHTPLNAVMVKTRVATPYHSAEKCSKCRFDKLETSSYWLSQIKLAESVGKHAVSASFFVLAFDCNAEPIRNLRVELKKYMARHERLKEEAEWRKVSLSYGLVQEDVKEETNLIK